MSKTLTASALGIIGMAMLSGCSLNDITNSEADTSWLPESIKEEVTNAIPTAVAQMEVKTTTTSEIQELSDEAFEKAFNKYLKNNPVEFGKKVDEAYKIYQAKLKQDEGKLKEEKAKNIRGISDKDHIKGSKDAEFVLFEYSDYHCPYCKKFHPTTTQFLKDNDDVALVFRPYPGVHRKTSAPLHQVAECIAKEEGNDAFWKFSDVAFDKGSSVTIANAESEMKTLGMTKTAEIMKCYTDKTFVSLVDDSEKEAQELGIDGTPGSILKNMKTGEIRVVSGAYPLEALQQFKEELSK